MFMEAFRGHNACCSYLAVPSFLARTSFIIVHVVMHAHKCIHTLALCACNCQLIAPPIRTSTCVCAGGAGVIFVRQFRRPHPY